MNIMIFGAPHTVGGAGVECWWAVKLWKQFGCNVSFIPTWGISDVEWLVKVENEGFGINYCKSEKDLSNVPGLAGRTVVAFCNDRATNCFRTLRSLGCKIVYCPLMCKVRSSERRGYKDAFPDTIVLQSDYQRRQLEPQLAQFGYTSSKGTMIHGGINFSDFEYKPRPHQKDEAFVVGRIARGHLGKWDKNLFKIYDGIPNRRALLLGASKMLVGSYPPWATVIAPGKIPAERIYRQLHAYVNSNGADDENWPAVGREAMAYGVPLVVENSWGWKEMVVNGETGLLADTKADLTRLATKLYHDEPYRMQLTKNALEHLKNLCDPDKLWNQWKEVL